MLAASIGSNDGSHRVSEESDRRWSITNSQSQKADIIEMMMQKQ